MVLESNSPSSSRCYRNYYYECEISGSHAY